MARRAVLETLHTEPLHFKVTKKWATPRPNKIIHLHIELDKVMEVGGK